MPLVFDVASGVVNSRFLDFFPFSENDFVPAKVDVGVRDVAQALMVALVVVPRMIMNVRL